MSAKTYAVQLARDAQAARYGDETYWDYLEQSALEAHDDLLARGEHEKAAEMLTRSLAEALRGNDSE